MNKNYVTFIKELKQSIIQSLYIANRLANKEQLLLNYRTGKNISEKIAMEKWGAKILDKIAEDLQVQLPGLKGFSASNLKKMRILQKHIPPYCKLVRQRRTCSCYWK